VVEWIACSPGLYSASNRIHPSFSNIISLRDVVIHVTLTTLLVRNGYLAENRVLSKKKQGMDSVLASSAVDCRFSPHLGQINDYKKLVFFASPLSTGIPLFQSYNSQPIPYVIVRRTILSIKSYSSLI
jgi:hypothetical protein